MRSAVYSAQVFPDEQTDGPETKDTHERFMVPYLAEVKDDIIGDDYLMNSESQGYKNEHDS